jgi:hypothetical protein
MRYALIENKRVEAQPELIGLCPGCNQPVIAKCGKQRINHWAHRSNKNCDSWWETETDWHRSWKSNFPVEWQEVYLPDVQTGEKHIADVRSIHGLVIEFQHSHINPRERVSREKFYGNMVWVVDGTRLKRDYPRFLKGKDQFKAIGNHGFFYFDFPEECFPSEWIDSSVPVIFDFQEISPVSNPEDMNRKILWCLLPGRAERHAVGVCMPRDIFVNQVLRHPELLNVQEFMNTFVKSLQQQRRLADQRAMKMLSMQRGRRGRGHFRF